MVSSIYGIFPGVVFNDALFLFRFIYKVLRGLPGGSVGKESACNAGDEGLILGLGRCPERGNGNPL